MTKRASTTRRTPSRTKSRRPALSLTATQRRWMLGVMWLTLAALTAIGLLSPGGGNLTDLWAGLLKRGVGWGAYVIPVALGLLGVWVIQRGVRHPIAIPRARLWGLLLLLVAGLTLTHHLVANPLAARAAGRGGGALGYALSTWLTHLLGWQSAVVLLVLLVVAGLLITLDVTLGEIADAASLLWGRLSDWLRIRKTARRARTLAGPSQPAAPILRPSARPASSRSTTAPAQPAPAHPALAVDPGMLPRASDEPLPWRLPLLGDILLQSEETVMSERDMVEKAHIIEDTLNSLGVPVRVVEVNPGPVVTQFGLEPGYTEHRSRDGVVTQSKVKVSRIAALANDLSLALAAAPIRIEAPVPGKAVVGVEVPNSETSVVGLRSVMESDEFQHVHSRLAVALGRDVSGRAVADDLSKLPHLLIAGATGSGKSVCMNALIACLICRNSPDDLRLLMIDPKRVELSLYAGIPHLLAPVIVESERVVSALNWVTREMERRYQVFARVGVRNLQSYNKATDTLGEGHLPYIVVCIDELADLMMVAADDVERLICRIAQMARATGIHLVIATQRPSVDVLTGLIKANFPARMAFAVTSQVDSRVILDTPGAEKLLGRGDALYVASDSPKLERIQGCYVSDPELTRLVNFWRNQLIDRPSSVGELALRDSLSGPLVQQPLWATAPAETAVGADADDALLAEATALVRREGRASVSFLQRHLRIGYTRAARLIDTLEDRGVIGPATGPSLVREIMPHEEHVDDSTV